nr:uncharacterized protein LOC118683567 [Bactrocera oleae]
MDAETIRAMTVETLKEKLRELGLNVTGRKKELQLRLLQHLVFGDEQAEDESENESTNSSYADAVAASSNAQKMLFTLGDVQDSVFYGNDTCDVHHWVVEFDEIADTVGWNNLQRFVYAKQLLKGAAKWFVRGLVGVRDWSSLKRSLDEFGEKICASEVHRVLRNKRKQTKESLQEYLYSIIEIGKPISLDEKSIIEYFVDGIPDAKTNKGILYQAKTVGELKEQIRIYEKVRGVQIAATKGYGGQIATESKGLMKKKCFKCDKEGHIARDCPEAGSSKIICFKCNKKGHFAQQCKDQRDRMIKSERVNTVDSKVETSASKGEMIFVDATINGFTFNALVDIGCIACIMRYDTLLMLGEIDLTGKKQRLFGIGKGVLTTLGSFTAEMTVEGLSWNVTFHVVRERDIPYAAMIGNDVLQEVELVFRKGSVEFRKPMKAGIAARHTGAGMASEGVYGGVEGVVSTHRELRDYGDSQGKVFREQKDITKSVVETGPEVMGDKRLIEEFEVLCSIETGICEETDRVDLSHLSAHDAKVVSGWIHSYCPKKPSHRPVEMKLILKNEKPVFQRPRRVSQADQQRIDEEVARMLKEGIIQNSVSEYASPVVLVTKKNGTKRFCCDFRKINEQIIRDNFPMTVVEEALDRLQGANVFTTLDLKNGFYHVPIEPGSRNYTSFVTQNGQYEFCFVPFGINNSPAVFCRYIRAIFQDMLADGTVIIYMDDIVIPAKDEIEGREKLGKVLKHACSPLGVGERAHFETFRSKCRNRSTFGCVKIRVWRSVIANGPRRQSIAPH